MVKVGEGRGTKEQRRRTVFWGTNTSIIWSHLIYQSHLLLPNMIFSPEMHSSSLSPHSFLLLCFVMLLSSPKILSILLCTY